MLRGREAECIRIDALLDAARQGQSSALVIRGEPGVGKSALLRYALDRATGMTTVITRGLESESELPFAGLADIVRPLHQAVAAIPAPQAAVLEGAVALGPPVGGDRFAVCAATLSLLAAAAESSPLLVAVDDIQWLDTGSAEAVLFAARRISAEGVVLLLAIREGEPTVLELLDLPVMHLRGLREEASMQLLADQTGPHVVPRIAAELHTATEGNPLALLEISNLLTEAQRAGSQPLPDPLPSGPGLERAFVRRLAMLPSQSRDALLVVATSDSTELAPIRRAMVLLNLAPATLEAAESAGLISLDVADIHFRHPLIRSAVYQSASAVGRREAHSALARVLDADQVADRRTWHLAAAAVEPDESVAAAMEQTAGRSIARSGYAASAKAFVRAAELTPALADRARRFLAAGNAFYLAGRPDEAIHCLDEALVCGPGQQVHGDIQHLRAVIEMWSRNPWTAYELLIAEAERALPDDPRAACELMAEAVGPSIMAGRVRKGLETAERALSIAQLVEGEPPILVWVMLAAALINCGHSAAGQELLDKSLARFKKSGEPQPALTGPLLLASLLDTERYEEARQLAAGAAAEARRAGALGVLPYVLAVLSDIEFRTGRWTEAYASASESVRLGRETDQRSAGSYTLVCLARIEAAYGLDTDCIEHVRTALQGARLHGAESIYAYAGAALGLLELGRGRPEEAAIHLDEVHRFTQGHGLGEPNVVQWQPDHVESLARTGRTAEALHALDLLEEQAEHTGRVWAKAAAARCRGYLSDAANSESHFTRAIALHQLKPTPFEIARTQLCFGEVLRRQRRRSEARDHLYEALHAFERLGAEPWAARARAELQATGERSRRRDVATSRQLTPQELQIALVVAGGATNREAAAQLFLSPKTIEAHLSSVYAKLTIRSRSELARAFANEQRGITTPTS
ncbi:MAG TPA: AAA family ATPase [Candidatus Udaeobacter sp.]|nr:AAA family ATPase [Candidatus Udaeobacter sp.]